MFHPTLTREEAEAIVRESSAYAAGRKFDSYDVSQPFVEAAVTYLETYTGDFEYVLTMHRVLANDCDLSDGQWAGVLNCFARELRAADLETPQVEVEHKTIPNGFYIVHLPGDEKVTIRVKDHWEKVGETKVVGYLSGPSNTTHYTGFGFVRGKRYSAWPRFAHKDNLRRAVNYLIDEGWRVAGVAYAEESGNCCFCNKVLTTDESRHYKYGPECAKKHGLPWGKVPK